MRRQRVIYVLCLITLLPVYAIAQTTSVSTSSVALDSHLVKADKLKQAGHIEEAAAELAKDRVILSPEGKQEDYYDYGMTQCGAGHFKTGIAALEKGIETAPKGALAGTIHYQLAGLWYNQHRYADAIPQFSAAVKFKGTNDAWTYLLLGDCLQKTGQLDAARQAWTHALTANDDAKTGAPSLARNLLRHFAHGSKQ